MTILASASLSLLVNAMLRLGMALRIATRDWIVFEYTTGLYCLKSSLVKPLSWMIFICLTIVLFPDSPAPSSSSLISLAAWIPSSFKFFSICLLRAREALSSALMAQPMMIACSGVRRASLLEPALPQAATAHHHFVTVPPMALPSGAAPGLHSH